MLMYLMGSLDIQESGPEQCARTRHPKKHCALKRGIRSEADRRLLNRVLEQAPVKQKTESSAGICSNEHSYGSNEQHGLSVHWILLRTFDAWDNCSCYDFYCSSIYVIN